MSFILLCIGVFGFLGLSLFCPLLALSAYFYKRLRYADHSSDELAASSRCSRMDIVIPAHNEAERIKSTLTSIQRSVQSLQGGAVNVFSTNIAMHVIADGCTDKTADIARGFSDVSVTESRENRSKWVTLKTFIMETKADWIILADAGILWPETFLSDVLQQIARETNVLAIAPAYRPLKAGWLHRVHWYFEMRLKRMETACGGPISLHGATVAYKTTSLKRALLYLGDTLWINDDVVIPLILRALYPEGVILYPVGEVRDAGITHDQMDLGRRKRMVLGNLQWVRTLLPSCFRLNPVTGVIAFRRIFRMLWAYWFVFMFTGFALAFHPVVLPAVAAFGLGLVFSGSFRQFAGAALFSLLAPFLLVGSKGQSQGAWE